MTCVYGSPSALFTFYFGIASQSDVVKPGDDNDMPLLCLTVSAYISAKLRCRLGSFCSKPFICFATLDRTLHENPAKNIQQWRISGKPSSSLALVANERIRPSDIHAQRKGQASHALACGTRVSQRI